MNIIFRELMKIKILNISDTITILLPFVTVEIAEKITDAIKSAIETMFIPHKESPYGKVTVSFGISYINNIHKISKQEFIESTDESLYEAKKNGKLV